MNEPPSDWLKDELENCVSCIIDYRGKTPEKTDCGVPLITAKIVKSGRIEKPTEFIDALNYDEWMRRGLPEIGDVLVTTEAPLGEVAQITNKKVALAQRIILLRGKPGFVDNTFLKYYLMSDRGKCELHTRATGTTVTGIKQSELRKISVLIPPFNEQRAIAHILGTLDDKIDLNRRMNETLEGTARALFKSWFIDFDPVRAKAEGKRPFGMDEETAALFPSEFEDSELGEIPRGWRIGSVEEQFKLTMGQSPPGSTYNDVGEGITFFQGRTDFGFRFPTPRVHCTSPTRFAEPGDTLVSVRAPVGDVNMAKIRCCIGRGLAALRHRSGGRSYTLYSMKALHEAFSNFESEGTVFGCINKDSFRSLKNIIPPDKLVAKFEALVNPMDQMIDNNDEQNKILIDIRHTILPKLLSGEIRAPIERVSNLQARLDVSAPAE